MTRLLLVALLSIGLWSTHSVEAADMTVEAGFTYKGKAAADPITPADIPKKAQDGATALAKGKLPTTGEAQSMSLIVLGLLIIILGTRFYYRKKRVSIGGPL